MTVFTLSTLYFGGTAGQVRYSVPEEMAPGSFVGDIAKDLGLDAKRLITGKAKIFSKNGREYVDLDRERGHIIIRERIDRESLCASSMSACSFSFEVILENPIELYRVTVEILDVNDNSPAFPKNEIEIEISESATPGARFTLESAVDPDVGINSLQSYSVHPTDHFTLKKQTRSGISKNVELVLQTPLDRERQQHMYLTLTAVDGGTPKRSGTVKIHIIILDANDNAPVFPQDSYKISVPENTAKGTLLTTVNATDADTEAYAPIQYYFEHAGASINELFSINATTGEIRLIGQLDFEKSPIHELSVQAKDRGGLSDSAEVIVEVTDVNDNAPTMALMSYSNSLPENAPPGTVIAMINVQDGDSEENGRVICTIDSSLPFKIKSSLTDYYSLVTDSDLDREHISEYNITVTAKDGGSPPLSSSKTLSVKISDINDHSPVFEHETYNAFIMENNSPSLSVLSLRASDADLGPNARISYFIGESDYKGTPVSSLVSINSESGVIYATKSFDYEQVKSFSINVKAQDGGSPPLSTNVTVNVFIQDQNDNAPQILYPVQSGGSVVAEIVPRSADVGYLVTKVVAVDVDSGQNAWLSYKLLKSTDRALFEIGTQNGEIRTIRQVTDKDAVKQKLTVVVEDNGQPSRSATVNVNVALADSFPEVLSEFSDFTHEKEYNDNLTFYLVLALAVVSLLSLFTFGILLVRCVRATTGGSACCMRRMDSDDFRARNLQLQLNSDGPIKYVEVLGGDMLSHSQSFRSCLSPLSEFSDFTLVKPSSTLDFKDMISVLDVSLPDNAWTFESLQNPRNERIR
ncbi:protocadherin gamma-A11-like [Sardina pilchardus]|uniref:protocadherin gamma-A11-like n=1 Tax=Sardina pilchardus TaxID=27697 RepID=UPI002E14FE17